MTTPRSQRHQLADMLRTAEINYKIEPIQGSGEQLKPVAAEICAFCRGKGRCLPSYTLTITGGDYWPRFTFDRHDQLVDVDVHP